jgi:hypothetical protein
MKRLFDLSDCYTYEANEFLCEATDAIEPLMKRMVKKGFSVRDIQTILIDAVNDISICARLSRSEKKED